MDRQVLKKIGIFLLAVIFLCIVVFIFSNYRVLSTSRKYIYQNVYDVPPAQTALVLGAGVKSNGQLSDILRDRADTAIQLYRDKKVAKILATGDNSTIHYNETKAMESYFLMHDIPSKDIFLDYAGFDTYDSLYRARDVFQAQSLIVVTQNFHLNRAVYYGRSIGMEVYGVSADKETYRGILWFKIRESLARMKGFFDILFHAKPKFLGTPIPLSGDGQHAIITSTTP
ncbi:MAG: YdcF family protein [Candidatus Magasanikbacteria bacterium]|nr:YdcF family protein [Candidatus Magasanikbacteria bacterium]